MKDNSLIDNVMLVERYKRAIPEMERMLETGSFFYIAGSLILNIEDPETKKGYINIEVRPIDDYASDTIRKGQYLASQLYVKHKKESCAFYKQAISNIAEYESTSRA